MECHENVLKEGLKKLSRLKDNYHKFCENYLNIEVYSKNNVQQIMDELCNLLLNPEYTLDICECFSQIFLEILYETIPLKSDTKNNSVRCYHQHVLNCILLGKLILIHPDVLKFSLQYFENYPAPFDETYFENITNSPPVPTKKRRCEQENLYKFTDFEVINCCYQFLKYATTFVREKWDWSKFVKKFLHHTDVPLTKWLVLQCVGICTGMSAETLKKFIDKYLPNSNNSDFIIEYEKICYKDSNKITYDSFSNFSDTKLDSTFLNKISKYVTSISDILIPIFNEKTIQKSTLIEVESTKRNLKKIALAIAANKAICLSGPVGSGKTALVEHIAGVTGRIVGDSLIKVQLGDQTDSKMLLGTYRCTDIPGEFIWQPGVLTQAIMNGNWILLEDINSASMDVVTVLSALLENNALSVPGFRDSIRIAPGFQLFFTQRLMTSVSGFHKQSTHSTIFIEKKVLNVNVEPLTQAELIEIVQKNFPALMTIANRIVDVYLVFSSGMHPRNDPNDSTGGDIQQNLGRLISTRDLIKFCSRAVIDFDVSSPESALKVFQDAIDIFCCSQSSSETRLSQACKISAHLGIVHTRAEYFCNEYKPRISLDRGNNSSSIVTGRVNLQYKHENFNFQQITAKFSFTRPSACLLERIACAVKNQEPVLLVGETGVGKTSAVQYLANALQQKMIVINMNQQSDSSDLLGGYKPVDMKFVIAPIRNEFEKLFREYFDVSKNAEFLQNISKCYNSNWYSTLLKLMTHSQSAAVANLRKDLENLSDASKKRRHVDEAKSDKIVEKENFLERWLNIGLKLSKLETQLKIQNTIAFAFVEGSLVIALERGYWVLLDEINLASAETLECLSGLLEGSNGSINLFERGDKTMLKRHKNFTLFACMNPATDVGKKELPAGLRNRFTEFFVDELTDKSDLIQLVNTYLNNFALPQNKIEGIVKFYLKIRKLAEKTLNDGTGHKPHFSLRTFCRALSVASRSADGTALLRSLYEAFCLSFLTQLDSKSHPMVEELISKAIFGDEKTKKSILKQEIQKPKDNKQYVQFEGYWISQGSLEPEIPNDYILTKSVRNNLHDLVRIVSLAKLPVLLQGDTSVGKTSLITYLAKSSGNRCMRINNHEHTDLQEYIGSYVADEQGKLVFREGILVQAMRQGFWIILDELNLAPSDVLEALNRVLDDNRELYIPETQETVKAHPNFMLFATQNPPGLYGGRKILSRAFRNRFVELHFDDIPSNELEIILEERCKIPASYSRKVIKIMKELQLRRRNSAAFAGKHGFMTLRDLFRWGERYRLADINQKGFYDWDQHLADEGYLLLAGKVRNENERKDIAEVIKKCMKKDTNENNLFSLHENTSLVTRKILETFEKHSEKFKNIVWTFNMRKLGVMISKALQFNEPVLLVGNTGGGKTTICQILSEIHQQKLYTINCHLYTESADFIGGLRPVRERTEDKNRLFEWSDGPLIQAMKEGALFLADEISLADDSVLERLNSLLEPERTLLIAEKGTTNDDNLIIAHKNFYFVSTMNPGGDFGKKELSPALKNRFTEIWCDTVKIRNDLVKIINQNVTKDIHFGVETTVGEIMIDFVEYFEQTDIGRRITISIRDLLTWIQFINICVSKKQISFANAYSHGVQLIFLDGLGSGVTSNEPHSNLLRFQDKCLTFVNDQLNKVHLSIIDVNIYPMMCTVRDQQFGIKPFYIPIGSINRKSGFGFTFSAPSTKHNTLRLLRAMQLNKAILLEGSPGVGKTSLVKALADASGHNLLRINLSDQTDVSDLFGSDLPVEGGQGGEFCWRDGPFLRALKNGDWILLDELNLASQSVLEGLNACLDHRGEIYIPELDKTFHIKQETRLFGCQNPLKEGGSRKGLPQSFLNRFIQVYISPLKPEDLEHIATQQYSEIPEHYIQNMIKFNERIVKEVSDLHTFGTSGGPWEFNLRDIQRWCTGLLKLKNDEIDYIDGKKWKTNVISNEDRDRADLLIEDLTKRRPQDKEAKIREVKRLLTATTPPYEAMDEDTPEPEQIKSIPSKEEVFFDEPEDSFYGCGSDNTLNNTINTSSAVLEASFSSSDLERRMQLILNPSRLLKLLYVDRMRTEADKNAIMTIYNEIFGSEFPASMNPPLFYITNDYVYLGDVKYRRGAAKITQSDKNLSVSTSTSLDMNILKHDSNYDQLILRAQFHVLKSLLLCVKFNWMAILVGPTGTGKSCAVRTLATLTGHELQTLSVNSSMDTTEILGGFEQVDYNRHLEEVSQKSYRLLLTVIQDCLLNHKDDIAFVIDLFEQWEKYKQLCKNDDEIRTMAEETDLFLTKLKELKLLIETFPKYIKLLTDDFYSILKRIDWLKSRVEHDGNLNAGGKFEWIDSTLVKCLRDGTWLLIDNVNLCSPAVLDRLNGVLEPNGSLIIGERGVDSNNELINIQPHPEFRLFLTMDPKNGEISRAMRNRGVEIYLLPSQDLSTTVISKNDLRSLLFGVCIENEDLQDLLITIHTFFEDSIIGEKPNITQLIYSGFLISQQIRRGLNLIDAITSTIDDIYIQSKLFNESIGQIKNSIKQMITTKCKTEMITKPTTDIINFNNLTLHALQLDPAFATIKQQTTSIITCLHLLANFGKVPIQISDKSYDSKSELYSHLTYLLIVYFQMYSTESLDLREKYLKMILTHCKTDSTIELIENLSNIITNLCKNLHQLNKQHGGNHEINKLPVDIRWLPEIAQYFYRKPFHIVNYSNPILFAIHYQIQNETQKYDKNDKTILQYAKERQISPEDTLRNPIINNLPKIIDLFNKFLHKIGYNHCSEISNQDYPNLIIASQWYFRFVKSTGLSVLNQLNIDQFITHFHWFINYCLPEFFRVSTGQMYDCKEFNELVNIIRNINKTRCALGSPLTNCGNNFKLRLLCPQPYTSLKQLQEYQLYNMYEQRLQLKPEYSWMLNNKKFKHFQQFYQNEDTQTALRYLSTFYCNTAIGKSNNGDLVKFNDNFDERKFIPTEVKKSIKLIPIMHHYLYTTIQGAMRFINEDIIYIKNFDELIFIENITKILDRIQTVPVSLYCNWNSFNNMISLLNSGNSENGIKLVRNILLPLQISMYDYLNNSSCRFPHNCLREENYRESGYEIMHPNYIHTPNLLYFVTNILINSTNSNRILEFSSLKENQMHLEELDTLLKLLWNNSCTVLSYDAVLHSAYLTRRNFIVFLKSLTKSLDDNDSNENNQPITTHMLNFATIRAHIDLCHDRLLEKIDRSGSSTISNIEITNICEFIQKSFQLVQTFYKTFNNIKTYLCDIYLMDCNPNKQVEKQSNQLINRLISIYTMLNIGIGYSKTVLTSQLLLIDPAKLLQIRYQYLLDDSVLLEQLCNAQTQQINVLYSNQTNFQHDLYHELQHKLHGLNLKINSFDNDTNEFLRPNDQKYQDLRKIVLNYNDQLNMVIDISNRLHNYITNMIDQPEMNINEIKNDIYTILGSAQTWLLSQDRYLNQLHEYLTYPDIVCPIKESCLEIRNGLINQIGLMEKLIMESNMQFEKFELNEQLSSLILFPMYGFLDIDHEAFVEIIPHILNDTETQQKIVVQELVRVLLFSLQDYWNYFCCPQRIPNEESWHRYLKLFNHIFKYWKTKEKEKLNIKVAEESLYKTIERKQLTENEQIELDFKETFPSFYDNDFNDLVQSKLDHKSKSSNDKNADSSSGSPSLLYDHILNDKETEFIYTNHTNIVRFYAESEWLHKQKPNFKPDFIKSLIQRYKTYTLLQNKVVHGMNYLLDKKLLPSYTFLTYIVKEAETCDNPAVFDSMKLEHSEYEERHFNFYQDEYVQAAKNCIVILNGLKREVIKVLDSNPEHAALQSILKIIDRIENFEITSPISRFLTGFELVLSKCNEWSQYARKSENLSNNIEIITRWIIDMRKFELQQWSNSLNNILQKVESKGKNYWWRLFEIVDEFINNVNDVPGNNATISDDKQTENNDIKMLITTLKYFIERSPIGEFRIRLNLIYSFHCFTTMLEFSERTNQIKNILWNVYQYYNQFSEIVKNRIKEIRKPIEKELKDFVKIAKWNDINYWSVKETVEKTHRTLHKFMRKFEDSLNELVSKKCLIDDQQLSFKELKKVNKFIIVPADSKLYLVNQSTWDKEQSTNTETDIIKNIDWKTDIIQNFPKYFNQSKQMCKKVIKLSTKSYNHSMETLNNFIIDVIDTSDQLRKLEVNQTLPKTKQKSDAKSILQQKRKALSDLFKSLQTIGISYKAGLLESNLFNIDLTYFSMKPIDLNASFQNLHSLKCDKHLLNYWDGCEKYYLKSIARYGHLQAAMKNPSPQLGVQNLERIRGFSTHLLITIQQQKQDLINTTRTLYYLRGHTMEFHNMFENQYFDILKDCKTSNLLLYETFININHFIKQLNDFFKSTQSILQNYNMNLDVNIQTSIPEPNTANYQKLLDSFEYIERVSRVTLDYLDKADNYAPTNEYTQKYETYLTEESLIEISCELDDIMEFMKPLHEALQHENLVHPLNIELQKCFHEIQVKHMLIDSYIIRIRELKETEQSSPSEKLSENGQKFVVQMEELVHATLLSLQKIFVKYRDNTKTIDDDDVLTENLLKIELMADLQNDLKQLNINKLLEYIRQLVQQFKQLSTNDLLQCTIGFKLIIPLIHQISMFYQYFVTQQVSIYRLTCKMSSILLNIFTELTIKGFCTPEGLDDEDEDGDGDGDGEGAGGMGLTEGTGEKDVSDRIESEDQLDSAKREEDYENQKVDDENKTKEEEGGIEMSEDFEGKLEDVEKDPEEQSDKDNDDEDVDKQMGETEPGAEELDTQLWGDDQPDDDDDDGSEAGEQPEGKQGDGEDTNEVDTNEGKDNKGKSEGDKEFGAKDDEEISKDDNDNGQKPDDTEEKEKSKEINEMNEPEFDEDQINPYHGKHDPLPEPEDFDMPEEMKLDDGEEKQDAEDGDEENPFDIDKMKENMPEDQLNPEIEEKNAPTEENPNKDGDDEDDGDDDTGVDMKLQLEEEEDNKSISETQPEDTKDGQVEEEEKNEPEEKTLPENIESQGGKSSNEDNIEAVEDDSKKTSEDNVEQTVGDDSKSKQSEDVTTNENKEDKEGVGQAQNEETSKMGHQSNLETKQENQLPSKENEHKREKRQKPGDTDSERSLGNTSEPIAKKLKVMELEKEKKDQPTVDDDKDEEKLDDVPKTSEAEHFQHVKESKEHDAQVLDAATKEQFEKQKLPNEEDEKVDEEKVDDESDVNILEEEEEDVQPSAEKPLLPEKTESKKNKEKKTDNKGDQLDQNMETEVEIEGETVNTLNVSRGFDTTYHTQFNIEASDTDTKLTPQQEFELRQQLENKLSNWKQPPTDTDAHATWQSYMILTNTLAHDLCEQLRIILEPTQISRLKGDYRTGRRINMRKVIPYIASQFRKDKIWLRRTHPAKREYQIVLAIDDSQSMADNQSKELAFESLSLLSTALSLLESGQLSVLCFGEDVDILHRLNDQFSDQSGAGILQKFQFSQKKTDVPKLINFTCDMFKQCESASSSSSPNAKLLIIVSDGRGVHSEGEEKILNAVRRAKNERIFVVFVIVDNPKNKDSILDIRMPVFKDGKLLEIKTYLEKFPFSFYIILRDIKQLPTILSDALRQWFELVTETT